MALLLCGHGLLIAAINCLIGKNGRPLYLVVGLFRLLVDFQFVITGKKRTQIFLMPPTYVKNNRHLKIAYTRNVYLSFSKKA